MSLDPRLGHLYHDSTASLDAKEQLRMREVNAREQRHLNHETYVLDRARNICERSRRWEHENVKRQMKKIRDRTLSLELSLKQESKRVSALPKDENIVTSAPSLVSRTSVFAEVPTTREIKSAPDFLPSRTVFVTNGFKRRNRNVVRALLKMYNRSDERRRLLEDTSFKLDPAQIDILQKARVVLRGTEAETEVSKILDKNTESRRPLTLDRVGHGRVVNIGPVTSNRADGASDDQPTYKDGDTNKSSKSDPAPLTWTRFNKLPELWKQQCTAKTAVDVPNTQMVPIRTKCGKPKVI